MKKFKLATLLRMLALVAVVVFPWAIARDRTELANWKLLPQYHGDPMQFMSIVKAASEGDFVPFWTEGSQRLGAPYSAHWEDYPQPGKFLILFLGLLVKWFGLAFMGNFGQVWLHILDAFAFYYCSRFLRHSKIWSFVGAALFSLTYFNLFNNMAGLHKCSSYVLPFAVLSCWVIFSSKRMRLGDRFSWLCLITGAGMGIAHPYNLGMYGFFLGFALLGQWVTYRRKPNLQIGVISLALAAVGFLALNAVTFTYQWAHGHNAAGLARNYFETELYALKPIEFVIPPTDHHVPALAEIGKKYQTSAWVKGEIFCPYQGLICTIGLIWIFWEFFLRLVKRYPLPRRFPAYAPQIGWAIAYAVIGGINCLLALAGFQLFRASNRYSIFVSLLTLMFVVSKMSVVSRRWSMGLKFTVAAIVLVIGIYDQVPHQQAPEVAGLMERTVVSDRAFFEKMEATLPPHTMVFELPVFSYPEGPTIRGVDCYDMFRPFLWTKTLRFSYGAMRGRPQQDWQWDVEQLSVPQMIGQLENYGFGAIFLLRTCYDDQGEGLLKKFAAAGKTQVFEDELHEWVCIVLNPSTHPEFPHTDDRAMLWFKDGWVLKDNTHPLNKEWATDQNRQWTSGNAMLTFFSESRQITGYSFRCVIGSIVPRRVSIVMDGHELWSSQVGAGESVPVDIAVIGRHGNNKVYFKTDAAPTQPKESPIPLAFTVVNLQVTKVP